MTALGSWQSDPGYGFEHLSLTDAEPQRRDAVRCLIRHGATDLVPVLGLEDVFEEA